MNTKSKPTVQTYFLKMSKEDHITGIKCYSLRTSILPEIIATYAGCNDDYFIFEAEVESCKITVFKFRGDIRYEAATSVVYFDEYVQRDKEGKPMGLWMRMPIVMMRL